MLLFYNMCIMENNVTARSGLLIDGKTLALLTEYVPPRETLASLSGLFSALSDGTRLKILSALSITPMCVNDLAAALDLNQTTVSHQLSRLRTAGAVDSRRQGRISFYSIKNKRILDVMLSAADYIA